MKLTGKYILSILLIFNFKLNAQNFQWLKTIGSSGANEALSNIITEPDSNVVFLSNSRNTAANPTTLNFDSVAFTVNPGIGQSQLFICRINSNKKVKNVVSLGHISVFGSSVLKALIRDSLGNFYFPAFMANTNADSVVIQNKWYYKKNGYCLILKLDKNFSVVWVSQTGNPFNTQCSNLQISSNRLYFNINSSIYQTPIGDSLYHLTKYQSYIYGEIDVSNGKIKWSKMPHLNKVGDNKFQIFDVMAFNQHIVIVGKNDSTVKISEKDTFPINSVFLQKVSLNGAVLKTRIIKSNKYIQPLYYESDKHRFYLSLWVVDTFVWNGINSLSSFGAGTFKKEFIFTSFDNELKPQEMHRPTVIDKSGLGTGSIFGMCAAGGYLYYHAVVTTKTKIGTDTFTVDPSRAGSGDFYLFKMDSRFNVLWKKNISSSWGTGTSIYTSDGFGSIYMAGAYRDSVIVGNLKDYSKGLNDIYILKISDNSIVRGDVFTGPYCAGDSIDVPYTKVGMFDTSNYFIAELSDENGEFTGKHHELGRLKTSIDSSIKGILPYFQVASSSKYRIRVVSTSPIIQSYYKYDSLRLLIYSKDKAYAGKDTTICLGQSLNIETKGGTKWHWSPSYKILDTSARQTLVWPDTTTRYKIVISDSSGCGMADTAFKTIAVRPALNIEMNSADTIVCLNSKVQLFAKCAGGDTLNYKLSWYSVTASGITKLEKESFASHTDTLNYTLPITVLDSIGFLLSLADDCTPKKAIAKYTLKVKKQSAQASFEFKDTSLCPGNSTVLVTNFKGSPRDKLSWSWQENTHIDDQWIQRRIGSNSLTDTWNYSLPLTWEGTKKIRLLLNDACSGQQDTSLLNILPKDSLQLKINTNDTTLCAGEKYTYKAIGKGGKSDSYQYIWIDTQTGDTLSRIDSLQIIAKTNKNISLQLSDGCIPKSASTQFKITVRAPLKITMTNQNDTVICDGQTLTYRAIANGGNGNYKYLWTENNITISNKDSTKIKHNINQATVRKVKVVVSDGCTQYNDSANINLHYKAPIGQSMNVIDSLCFGAKATLKSKASGGIDKYYYQWLINTTPASTTDSLNITNTNAGKSTYTSIVKDGCSSPDTISINIVNIEPLELQLTTADSCPTGTTAIQAKLTGGKQSQLMINWYNNTNQIHQGSTLNINPSTYNNKLFTAIANDGCTIKSDTANILIGSAPKVKIHAIGECLGDTSKFTIQQLNQTKITNYQWQINGNSIGSNDSIVKNFFSQIGPYKISVKVSSDNNLCKSSDSLSGYILFKPKAAFIFAHFDRTQLGIPFKFINQSTNDNTWLWEFGNGDTSQHKHPDYIYKDTGKAWVKLIVSNMGKCFDSASMILPIMDKIEFFYPNVFSPNGNGINETFGLSNNQWNKVKEYNIKIYNRWGEKIFDSDHMEEHWTGDKAQQGVYIYKVKIRDIYNVLHEQEGIVELLK